MYCVGVQTPNCIRQTVFDAVALDFPSVSVIVDATAAATPEVHACEFIESNSMTCFNLLNLVSKPSLTCYELCNLKLDKFSIIFNQEEP